MRIIITESRLKSYINNRLDYDLSDRIEIIDKPLNAPTITRYVFSDRDEFVYNLVTWGPMYVFTSPNNNDYLAQKRKDGDWFVYDIFGNRISENELLSKMGIDFGIPLDKIIKHYVTK